MSIACVEDRVSLLLVKSDTAHRVNTYGDAVAHVRRQKWGHSDTLLSTLLPLK